MFIVGLMIFDLDKYLKMFEFVKRIKKGNMYNIVDTDLMYFRNAQSITLFHMEITDEGL